MATNRQNRSMRRQHAGPSTVTVPKPATRASAPTEEDSELAAIMNISRAAWKANWDAQTVARSRAKVSIHEARAAERAAASKAAPDDKRTAGSAQTAQRVLAQKAKTLAQREANLQKSIAAVPRDEQAFVREVITAIDNHFRRTYS